jgi:hypothetical protein
MLTSRIRCSLVPSSVVIGHPAAGSVLGQAPVLIGAVMAAVDVELRTVARGGRRIVQAQAVRLQHVLAAAGVLPDLVGRAAPPTPPGPRSRSAATPGPSGRDRGHRPRTRVGDVGGNRMAGTSGRLAPVPPSPSMAGGLGARATPGTAAGGAAARAALADPVTMASTASTSASFVCMIPVPRQDIAPAETPGYGQPLPAHSADCTKDPTPKVLTN